MDIRIEGYRGIRRAEITGLGDRYLVAFVSGYNGAGKSSIAQAVGAAMTGAMLPKNISLKKSEIKEIVNKASSVARVSVTSEHGGRTIEIPSCEVGESGSLNASKIAVGLCNLSEEDIKSKASILSEYLKTEPTKADLEFALNAEGYKDLVDGVWDAIAKGGWDGALKNAKEYGARAKGAWEAVTGKSYGSRVAEGYTPDGVEIEDVLSVIASLDHYKEELKDREAERIESVKASAVSEEKVRELNERASKIDSLKKAVSSLEDEMRSVTDDISKIEREPELPKQDTTTKCPFCGESVVIAGGELHKAGDDIDVEPIKARIDAIKSERKALNDKRSDIASKLSDKKAALSGAEGAKKELLGMGDCSGKSHRRLEDIEQDIADDKHLISAAEKFSSASEHNANVKKYVTICKVLAQDGLRKQKTTEALKSFNERLSDLCSAAGWSIVSIDMDLSIYYGNTPYMLLSESEKYRVNCTIRSAMSVMDESPIMVFDGADILDVKGKNALFNLIDAVKIPSIVCMTVSTRDRAPKSVNGKSASFWVDGGIMEDVCCGGVNG